MQNLVKVNFEELSLLGKVKDLLDVMEDSQITDLFDKLAIVTEIRSLLSANEKELDFESIINAMLHAF